MWEDDPDVDSAFVAPPYSFTSDESDSISRIMADVNTYCDEMILKFITGGEPLDNFDAYVKNVQDMKIDEVQKIHQTAYERFMGQ